MKNEREELERAKLIKTLTEQLPALRATLGISQAEIADWIGISRQTYCSFEIGKRMMSWTTFLTLFVFFVSNEKTCEYMKIKKGYVEQVYEKINYKPESAVFQSSLGMNRNTQDEYENEY